MKKNIILILIIATLVIAIAAIFNFKNQHFVFDSSSKNIGVFLEGDTTDYYKTDDKNIKYFIKNYLAKMVPDNAPEDSKYLSFAVVYYNQNQLLAQENGAVTVFYNLYDIKTGNKLNTDCYINKSEGYIKQGNVIASIFPSHNSSNYSDQNICLYELGNNNFKLIKLNDYLKNNETFIKNINNQSYNSTPLYEYAINIEKRAITLSVFNTTNKNSGSGNTYARSVEVAY